MEKETTVQTTLRIPKSLIEEVKIYAERENLSVNKYITSALITAVFNSKQNAENKKGKKDKNITDIMMRR